MSVNKKVLDKVYFNISKKLDNCFYKNCKKGNCNDTFFIKHTGNCKAFFDEVHSIIWHTYQDLLFTNQPQLKLKEIYNDKGEVINTIDMHADALSRLSNLNESFKSKIRAKFDEEVRLEDK